MSKRRLIGISFVAAAALLAAARPASADITAFTGVLTSPAANRPALGVGIGFGLLIVGFEAEYTTSSEDLAEQTPSFRAGSFNLLLQTPIELAGIQLYFTAGGTVYRERLDLHSETHVAANTGGGAKIRLAGPLRVRLDYRLFRLSGEPLASRRHRFYAGLNLTF